MSQFLTPTKDSKNYLRILLGERGSYLVKFIFIFIFVAQNLHAQNLQETVIPLFSQQHGFYNSPVIVTLTTSLPNSQIIYTTDGSEPDLLNSEIYVDPLYLEKTSILRARIKNSAALLGPVVTQTYIFLDDVIKQSNSPAGYPTEWGPYTAISGFAVSDYEMDPEITQNINYASRIKESLLSLPTVSLVTDKKNLFGKENNEQTGGIYIYTGAPGSNEVPVAGKGWERAVSMEFIDKNRKLDFQINCGIQLHGGHSRRPEKSPKHSFKLKFKDEYGPTRLNEVLFGDTVSSNFNSLVLSAGFGNTFVHWQHGERMRMQLIRDSWAKDTQLAMGHFAGHGRFVHLYLNGLYWGIYNLTEQLDEDFAEAYIGGESEDYDIIKDFDEVVAGNGNAWKDLLQLSSANLALDVNYYKLLGKNSNGSRNASYPVLVDPTNLADYMIINFYGGNTDWDHHNWISIRNRLLPDKGFQFFTWDSEHVLKNLTDNTIAENNTGRPSFIFRQMLNNAHFKELFINRVQLHCFNGGTLTPESIINRWIERSDEIESAIIAESARWGDYRRDVHPYATDGPFLLYTPEVWLEEKSYLLNTYFPQRTDAFIQQLRSAGIFPSLSGPEFLINNKKITSNRINVGDKLAMTSSQGIIHYTLNGQDPKDGNGLPYTNPFMLGKSTTIKARSLSGNQWSALSQTDFVLPNEIANLKITEIHYHPLATKTEDDKDLEFIELKNTGTSRLDLSGIRIDSAIRYSLGSKTIIEPGGFIVLASDAVAFYKRYGYSATGEYKGFLDNAGEFIELKLYDEVFATASYLDEFPWPVFTDGEGYSLVPTELNPIGNPNTPEYWRASLYAGGSPFRDDVLITSVDDSPKQHILFQNYPNPFKETTSISYSLAESGYIELKIYDNLGREQAIIVNDYQPSGKYEISYVPDNKESGLFHYRLIINGQPTETKKMIFLE